MTYDKFIYRISTNEVEGKIYGFAVTISYYDPERWNGVGGALFACETELLVDDRGSWDNEGNSLGREIRIQVMQQGNSAVSIEFAEMRDEVNRQVLEMAYLVRDAIDAGRDLGQIVELFNITLQPGTPIAHEFRFNYERGVFA